MSQLRIRRAAERFGTRTPGVRTRHGFSFGRHYDPAHTSHGLLLVHDEHLLEPGAGFGPHPHRDVEIVSWVLEGALVHEHEHGSGSAVVPAGSVQRLTAGSGIVHAERAADLPTRFVQLWLMPSAPGGAPSYEQVVVPAASGLVPVLPEVGSRAAVAVARLAAGQRVALPPAAFVHLFVARGTVTVDVTMDVPVDGPVDAAAELHAGDAALVTGPGPVSLRGAQGAEVLVVLMQPPPARGGE